MDNKNIKKFYQQSPRPFNYVPNDLVDATPSIPPTMSGLMKINPATGDIWVSAGNTLVSDWRLITGGGGGTTITLETNGDPNGDQTLLNLRQSTGITLEDTGTGTVLISADYSNLKQFEIARADETVILTSTFIELTNVTVAVLAGYVYSFRIFCAFDMSNISYATRWAVTTADTAPVYLGYSTSAPGSAIGSFIYNSSVTTFNGTTNAAGTNISATGNVAIIEGIYAPSVDTTLRISVANESQGGSSNLTLKAGSYIEYYQTAI